MKTLPISKENVNPVSPSTDYGLRKSIPLKFSSILKSSNIIPTHQTLAQVTAQYETDLKKLNQTAPKTPLIRIDQEKNQNHILFTNKPRKSMTTAPNFVKEKSLIAKQSQFKQKTCENQSIKDEQLHQKLQQLVEMIHQDDKSELKRCHSSINRDIRNQTPLITRNAAKFEGQIPLPEPIESVRTSKDESSMAVRVRTPSFLTKLGGKSRRSGPDFQEARTLLARSSYFQTESNLRANDQRMSHYQANSQVQKPQFSQLRLCINCLNYVPSKSVTEHQKTCLGFDIILKMSNSQLIDFLNQKISENLNQLKQVETKINSFKKSSSQMDSSEMGFLMQKKCKTDQIINDLDGIRLKALKRFYTKNVHTKKI